MWRDIAENPEQIYAKSGIPHAFVISHETAVIFSAQYRKERSYEFENSVIHP